MKLFGVFRGGYVFFPCGFQGIWVHQVDYVEKSEEIIEYTSPDEVAVCNLASIALPSFANSEGHPYDFQKLYEAPLTSIRGFPKGVGVFFMSACEVTKVVTKNLNKARETGGLFVCLLK